MRAVAHAAVNQPLPPASRCASGLRLRATIATMLTAGPIARAPSAGPQPHSRRSDLYGGETTVGVFEQCS